MRQIEGWPRRPSDSRLNSWGGASSVRAGRGATCCRCVKGERRHGARPGAVHGRLPSGWIGRRSSRRLGPVVSRTQEWEGRAPLRRAPQARSARMSPSDADVFVHPRSGLRVKNEGCSTREPTGCAPPAADDMRPGASLLARAVSARPAVPRAAPLTRADNPVMMPDAVVTLPG